MTQQQPSSTRHHPFRRRPSLYDYTRQWVARGLGSRPPPSSRPVRTVLPPKTSATRLPAGSASSSSRQHAAGTLRCTRWWYACICGAFVVNVMLSIASIVFVVWRLGQVRQADSRLVQEFREQVGSPRLIQFHLGTLMRNWELGTYRVEFIRGLLQVSVIAGIVGATITYDYLIILLQ